MPGYPASYQLFSKSFSPEMSIPPQPAVSVYSLDDAGHQVTDIIEGRESYVECASPATTLDDDISLTIYRDVQNMNCYRPSDTPGKYLSDESGYSEP